MTDHPDLIKLTALREEQNKHAPDDPTDPYFAELFASVVDEPSLLRFAQTTIIDSAKRLATEPQTAETMFAILMALYSDGFVAGALFERNGGTTRV